MIGLTLARLRNGRDEVGGPAGLYDSLCRLVGRVQLPMPIRTPIWAVQNGTGKKRVVQTVQNTGMQSGELFDILAPIVGILGIALAVGLGAGIGALGGLIGKRRTSSPMQPSQSSMFSSTHTFPPNRQ